METLPVTWETFVARRRLNVKDWLAANGITNYQAMVDHLQKKGIAPPALTSVEMHFRKPRKAPKPKPAPEPVLTPEPVAGKETDPEKEPSTTPKKKRGRRKVQHNKEDE